MPAVRYWRLLTIIALFSCAPARIGEQDSGGDSALVELSSSALGAFGYPPIPSNAYIACLITGQSNCEGTGGAPALSLTQPYNNREVAVDLLSLVPLIEGDAPPNIETAASSLGNTLHLIDTLSRDVIVSRNGAGGVGYASLKKGTTRYALGLAQCEAARTLTSTLAGCFQVVIHAEADDNQTTARTVYASYLVEWQHDWEADMQTQFSNSYTYPMFLTQVSAWTRYGTGQTQAGSALAQYDTWKSSPTRFVLIPTYATPYFAGGIHYSNLGHQMNGSNIARAIKQTLIDLSPWAPLHPAKVSSVGRIVDIQVAGGDGSPLVIDKAAPMLSRWMRTSGFRYLGAGEAEPAGVQLVTITGTGAIQLQLDRSAQVGGVIGYGDLGLNACATGPTSQCAPGGNIRNTTSNRSDKWLVINQETLAPNTPDAPYTTYQDHALASTPSSYLTVPDLTPMNSAQRLTLLHIFKRNPSNVWNSREQIFARGKSVTQNSLYVELNVNEGIGVIVPTSLSNASTRGWTARPLSQGAWHFVVVVYDGTQTGNANRLKIWVDDRWEAVTYAGTIPAALTTGSTGPTLVGAKHNGIQPVNFASYGTLAQTALWIGTAATQTQITEIASRAMDLTASSLGQPAAWYKMGMDSAVLPTVPNAGTLGSGYDATATGGLIVTTPLPP